jgi:hypothetical protein
MKAQNWSAAGWEFSPVIMASTYADWSQMGHAYQLKAGEAASVTPDIQAKADEITAGISGHRAQAQAIYEWVAQNIRYVAVYLGNGGLEPNSADSILSNHYGDCKDHTVILGALLAAKGIDSTPVLIGAGGGPTLPAVPVLGRFNHAINYLPEFDLYLDSTTPFARFGQLPAADLGAPVVHAIDGKVARTPRDGPQVNAVRIFAHYNFSPNGDVIGKTMLQSSASGEISMRGSLSQLNAQIRSQVEASTVASAGFNGNGKLELLGDALDLQHPFGFAFSFTASDYADFSVVGGMSLPQAPSVGSMRIAYASTSSETNLMPFYCNEALQEETYELVFPASVPVVAIPKSEHFSNAAGEYDVQWSRDGQAVKSVHRLHKNAIHGDDRLCQPGDYAAFRELYQQVRRGFRGQIIYGDLKTVQVAGGAK